MSIFTTELYPGLKVEINKNPNKFYAVPVLGMLVKWIMLIPILFVMIGLGIAMVVLIFLINPFVVLFTGKYWKMAYDLNLASLRYTAKWMFFLYGITDKYPGFNFETQGFTLDMPMPQTPNRLFALPIVGGAARMILLIPFYIFYDVVVYAAYVAIFISGWFFVLFKGRYAETLHELGVDSVRLMIAQTAYLTGLSDRYPSFQISWNHKNIKIALFILAVLYIIYATFFAPKKTEGPASDSYWIEKQGIEQQSNPYSSTAPETYTQ